MLITQTGIPKCQGVLGTHCANIPMTLYYKSDCKVDCNLATSEDEMSLFALLYFILIYGMALLCLLLSIYYKSYITTHVMTNVKVGKPFY